MNNIKFRAFVKHIGWVVPVTQINFDVETIEADLSSGQGDTSEYRFDEIELMQYIGLEDEQGNEMWEGNIYEDKEHMLWEIVFYEGLYLMENIHIPGRMFIKKDLRLRGNKFENSELLEK